MTKAAIIKENTKSRIINISDGQLSLLRSAVCYFDMGAYLMANKWVKKNRRHTFQKNMVDENGFFPTGITHRVVAHLNSKGIDVDILDNRVVPKLNKINLYTKCNEFTAYDDQEKCTAALIKAGQGIGQVPTGVGKTRIIKDNIQALGLRSVVITPSSNLKEQMAEYLEDCFGSENVGIYDKRLNNKPVTVINYQSFANTDPRLWEDYDNVQFDEFHHGSNNTIRDFNQSHLNSFYYRHGVTATNFTSDDYSSILLEAVLSNTVFSMSILEAIQKKYIVPIVPIFFDIPNENLVSQDDYRKDYKDFVDNNVTRNQIIADTQDKMRSMGIPTLTLVKHIQHGKNLCTGDSVFLNGQEKDAAYNKNQVANFNKGSINSIVGTSVIGEGVDTKACGAVINGKGGKSKREILQNVGRAVRKFEGKDVGYFFDFIDRRQKNLYKHSRERIKIVEKEFGIKAKIIKI